MLQPEQILKLHYDNHPAMEVQDAVKLLHQHFCGPGHLISDSQLALDQLTAEYAATSSDPSAPLFDSIGNGLCRLNLAACKAQSIGIQTVARLLVLTSNFFTADEDGFMDALTHIYDLSFEPNKVEEYLVRYHAQGCHMVSHSESYRQAYRPAYRVVFQYYVNILPAICAIEKAQAEQPRLRVAIDGPCASGKSTMGAALAEIFHCPLIHMDDFFLRPEQRTPARLAQPGGNVDYERFLEEIVSPMSRGEIVTYRPWRCGVGDFGSPIVIPPAPLTIVEGCYSLREDLRDFFQLRIWIEADWPSRELRLLARGGPDCLESFRSQWIPLEDRYFESHRVAQCCHLRLDLSD